MNTHKVVVKDIGPFRINTIRAIRETTPSGLKEAYDFVNTVMPADLITGTESFCRKVRKILIKAGASASVVKK